MAKAVMAEQVARKGQRLREPRNAALFAGDPSI
jgi:hypothetical protein